MAVIPCQTIVNKPKISPPWSLTRWLDGGHHYDEQYWGSTSYQFAKLLQTNFMTLLLLVRHLNIRPTTNDGIIAHPFKRPNTSLQSVANPNQRNLYVSHTTTETLTTCNNTKNEDFRGDVLKYGPRYLLLLLLLLLPFLPQIWCLLFMGGRFFWEAQRKLYFVERKKKLTS